MKVKATALIGVFLTFLFLELSQAKTQISCDESMTEILALTEYSYLNAQGKPVEGSILSPIPHQWSVAGGSKLGALYISAREGLDLSLRVVRQAKGKTLSTQTYPVQSRAQLKDVDHGKTKREPVRSVQGLEFTSLTQRGGHAKVNITLSILNKDLFVCSQTLTIQESP